MRRNGVWYGIHPHPARRDRSDFIINSRADVGNGEVGFEQLFSKRLAANQFELCCVPCYSYGISLGDVVETGNYEGREFVVSGVVESSNHDTLRVWFGVVKNAHVAEENRARIFEALTQFGLTLEWCSRDLLGVDIPIEINTDDIVKFLQEMEDSGVLTFEIGSRSGDDS